jgi:hypothetical protein
VTPLDKTLKRAMTIDGQQYVITLSRDALKIARKNHRLGIELRWADLISGDTALAAALRASIGRLEDRPPLAAKRLPSALRNRPASQRAAPRSKRKAARSRRP